MRVGLVGAATWARRMHAPMLAAGPETELVGVWARRSDAARRLAAAAGTLAVASFDELLDTCEAVDFAVPPDVQATSVPRAAARGKAQNLVLEESNHRPRRPLRRSCRSVGIPAG